MQHNIITNYNNNDFIRIKKWEDDLLVSIIISYDSKTKNYSILWLMNRFNRKDANYDVNDDGQINLPENLPELSSAVTCNNIYFNIKFPKENNFLVEKIYNDFTKQIKEKNFNKKNLQFLDEFSFKIEHLVFPSQYSIRINGNEKKMSYRIVIDRKNDLLLFSFDTENLWKQICLENLKNQDVLDERIVYLADIIFSNFDFFQEPFFLKQVKKTEKSSNISDITKFDTINKNNKKSKLLDYDILIYSLKKFKLSEQTMQEIKEYFTFYARLTSEEIFCVFILYFSIDDNVKKMIINRMVTLNKHPLGILFYYMLNHFEYITMEERDFMINTNLLYGDLFNNFGGNIFLENNPIFQNIKIKLNKIKFDPSDNNIFFCVYYFCSILNDLYLDKNILGEDNTWKANYDMIFDKLNIKEERNIFFLFQNIIKDQEKFINIIEQKNNIIWQHLADSLIVYCDLTIGRANFYFWPEQNDLMSFKFDPQLQALIFN